MKACIKFVLSFILAICSLQVDGQPGKEHMEGSWQGVLNVGSMELRLAFNLSLNEDQTWKATMDSPDQGQTGIPLGEVKFTDDSIRIEAPGLLGFYSGRIVSPSTLEGEWTQAGRVFKLDLEKQVEAFKLNRPQEPHPPYPYQEEEVRFENTREGFTLAGTLTIPEGDGPFPAAILITGSGSQNRDEEIFGHKPFKVIADYLTRNGIAVLRYDDRGVNASEGTAAGATSADLAEDARSAMDFLLTRSEINPLKIGIIGHSEGALIAFILASSHKDFAYVVSLAGPGLDGKTILLDQSEHINRLSGVAATILEDNRRVMSKVYDLMITSESYQSWREETSDYMRKYYSEDPAGEYSEQQVSQAIENLLASITESAYPWMQYFVMFDPAPLFASISCPVLALNGEKDCQVLPEANIDVINKGLLDAGNTDSKTMILPGLNHLFQNCETGLLNEYGIIEETFDQETLKITSDWIKLKVD